MKKYASVWEYLIEGQHNRPKTFFELLIMVDKSKCSINNEIRNLIKHDLIERIEVSFDKDSNGKFVIYRKKKE